MQTERTDKGWKGEGSCGAVVKHRRTLRPLRPLEAEESESEERTGKQKRRETRERRLCATGDFPSSPRALRWIALI